MPDGMRVILTIVERGRGAAMIRLYTKHQVFLHCQFPGRGTATSEIMDILGLGSSEKDVVVSFAAASASWTATCGGASAPAASPSACRCPP